MRSVAHAWWARTVVWRPRTLTMAKASAVPEVRVEGEADHDQQLADLVLAGEPHALVGLSVGRPHDAHGIGRVVDEELVEAGEGGVLVGRRGRGEAPAGLGAEAPAWVGLCSELSDAVGAGASCRTCRGGRRVFGPCGPVRLERGSGPRWHSTLAPCPGTSASTRATRPSSSGTTTTSVLAQAARRGPGPRVRARVLGRHPLRGHPEPQPRPGPVLLGTGRAGQRPDARERARRCRPARSCTWIRPSTPPSAGWSTAGSRPVRCRGWPSRSAAARRRCSTPSRPARRSTSSPSSRRRSRSP